MSRSKVRIALVSTLVFSFACNDDGVGVAEDGRGTGTETAGTATQGSDNSDDERGDEDSGDGDGDGDSGDGDGDGDSGDGDSGDGDGDSGDGDSGDGDGDSGDGDGDSGDGDGDSGIDSEFGLIWCGDKLFECGDGLDNDMDGLADLADPECTSPCDDSEATFKTDLPGQNEDCKQDCYFDANSGHGDDMCLWNLICDEENPGEEIGCEHDPDFLMCALETPAECQNFCEPLVPNGCDCFGCCKINGMNVYLDGAECTLASLSDCASCTFIDDCSNPCDDECEVCAGQTIADLPPQCDEPACPDGVTSCAIIDDCEEGQFCLTGCCAAIVPQ